MTKQQKLISKVIQILVDRGPMHLNDVAKMLRCSAGKVYYSIYHHDKAKEIDLGKPKRVQSRQGWYWVGCHDRQYDCWLRLGG